MPYCYCAPNRGQYVRFEDQYARAQLAHLAVGEGLSPNSYLVRGSKGYEVSRQGRAIALRAWETRRQREAGRKAAEEAARRPGHPVIEGTLPADAQPTRSLVMTTRV